MLTATGKPPARIWGLEKIAIHLGVSRRTLIRLLKLPAGERPPVRHCHRGWYAYESRLQDWVDAEDMDAGVWLEMQAGRAHSGTSTPETAADQVN